MNTPMNELLLLLKDEFDNDDQLSGLCSACTSLYIQNRISSIQYHRLRDYIYNNKPEGYKFTTFNGYYWTIKDRESRNDWLTLNIKITTK